MVCITESDPYQNLGFYAHTLLMTNFKGLTHSKYRMGGKVLQMDVQYHEV